MGVEGRGSAVLGEEQSELLCCGFRTGPEAASDWSPLAAGRAGGAAHSTRTWRLARPVQRSRKTRVLILAWRCACTTSNKRQPALRMMVLVLVLVYWTVNSRHTATFRSHVGQLGKLALSHVRPGLPCRTPPHNMSRPLNLQLSHEPSG